MSHYFHLLRMCFLIHRDSPASAGGQVQTRHSAAAKTLQDGVKQDLVCGPLFTHAQTYTIISFYFSWSNIISTVSEIHKTNITLSANYLKHTKAEDFVQCENNMWGT